MSSSTTSIKAAGGVVVDLSRNKPRYLLVHHARRDEWSFPNGKLTGGETHRDAALRSVRAESGLDCEILSKLSEVKLTTRKNNDKIIRFWLMEPLGGSFAPSETVDAVVWLKRSQAMGLLTFGRDRKLLTEAHKILAGFRPAPSAPSVPFADNLAFLNQLEALKQ